VFFFFYDILSIFTSPVITEHTRTSKGTLVSRG